ncbi:hypothetical protein JCM16418A_26250 [Paenibacillus pini]
MFLPWDMFLAWVPVGLVLLLACIATTLKKSMGKRVLVILIGLAWLFFYPNSAYLITDLIHPFVHYRRPDAGMNFTRDIEFWYHLSIFFSAALIGLLLGVWSLYIVHQLMKKVYGAIIGWTIAIFILLLSSFGIYIGRFVRWNSWDLLLKPGEIIQDTVHMLTDIEQLRLILPFSTLIFAVTLISYLVVYFFTLVGKDTNLK